MPGPKPTNIILSERQQTVLEQIARRHQTPQQQAKRAQLILNMAQGHNNQQAANIVGVHRETAQQWRNRWLEALNTLTAIELGGMDDKELLGVVVKIFTDVPRMGAPVTFTAKQVAQLLALACEEPQSSGRPISHWSSRELADEAIKRGIFQSISPRSVGRFLKGSRN